MGARQPRRDARYVELQLQRLDDGRLRVSTPQARGHATIAKGPDQLWHAVAAAFREATIAGYAMFHGVPYDLDALTDPTDPTEPKRRRPRTRREVNGDASEVSYGHLAAVRPDQIHPAEFTPNPDGSWTSGRSGRTFRDPKKIQSLIIRRARMGLPTSYQEYCDSVGEPA
jgi:hypothetical protein